MLLGPVASRIGSQRLLVVGDGVLRYIPFEALLLPASSPPNLNGDTNPEVLVSNHEIAVLPSASTLAALRSERYKRSTASKTIEIIADPVFERDDPRVISKVGNSLVEGEGAGIYLSTAMRDLNDGGAPQNISRLPATLREGKGIMDLLAPGDGVIKTGFEATKQKFIGERMGDYKIIHLATHGLLDNEHPDLSGVVLSLVDEHGNSVDGFLRLHDIYGLDLSADLVVLSACRTGLGKNIRGEGAIGLSSGFMYAGATSVVASLWKVDDNATAEFMNYFYAAILRDGATPSSALRTAKLEMRKQARWHEPFYWAGFILQGDYRNEVRHHSRSNWTKTLVITTVLVLAMAGIYFSLRAKRRSRASTRFFI
jgi:CHAT domain-containing protein